MLQYDNSAFYFFAISTISLYLVPSWYYIISQVLTVLTVKDETIGAVVRTSTEKKKADRLKKESKALSTTVLQSRSFLLNLVFTVVLTAAFVFMVYNLSADAQVNSFDPFSILEIDYASDAKTIKKAYRKLSLLYHPDKNPGNRAAEAKFVMVSKAYEALTDETARENWEKYGNPDGRQNLQVSIGLPAFLLEKDNKNLVLVGYLIIMVGVIPYLVYTYYSDSSKFGEKNVMYDTYAWFHHSLSKHTLVKNLPEAFAGSAEFRKRNMPSTAAQKQSIAKQTARVKAHMLKPKFQHPVCVKGNVLLHSHLLRQTDSLTESDSGDLKYMLKQSTSLVDAMISVSKNMEAPETVLHCIDFGQYVTQGLWVKDSQLLQLPHYGPDQIKECQKQKIVTMQDFLKWRPKKKDGDDDDDDDDEEEKEDIANDVERPGMEGMTEQQKSDIRAYLKMFPNVTLDVRIFVDDDEDDKVYEGDVCTVQVKVTRHNLKVGEKADLIHAPYFPFPKREAFWLMLAQIKEGKIMNIEKATRSGRVVTHEFRMMAPPKGKYEFDLVVKSNGYVGADVQTRVTMEVLDNSSLPEYQVHPEDAELDEEPTLFETILNDQVEDDDSDDEDDDDDAAQKTKAANAGKTTAGQGDDSGKAEEARSMSAAARKRAQLRKARQGADDDDDDDDDDAEDVTPH